MPPIHKVQDHPKTHVATKNTLPNYLGNHTGAGPASLAAALLLFLLP
jgi:hypothetical protein